MNLLVSSSKHQAARWAEFALLCTAIAWGSTFFMTKNSLASIDPVALVGYRFGLSACVLLPYLLAKKRNLARHALEGIALGVLLFILMVSQTLGLQYTTASSSGFITGTQVLFVPLIGFLAFGHRPRQGTLIAILISIVGLLVMTRGLQSANRGDAWTLLCAITTAMHIVLISRFRHRNLDPVLLGTQQFLVTAILCAGLVAVQDRSWEIHTGSTTRVMLYLALVPTLLAYLAQLVAQRYTSATRAALILVLEAPLAAVMAWTLGGESFLGMAGLGGLLMFGSVVLADRTDSATSRID